MSRRPLGLGEHGEIEVTPQVKDETGKWKRAPYARSAQRWRARCSYRGHDGLIGELSRFAKTKRLATEALDKALTERQNAGVEMTSDTRLTEAGQQWLTQIKRTDSRLSAKTIEAYEGGFFRYVDVDGSSIRGLTLTQLNDPQRLKKFLQNVADKHGTASAKMAKSIVSGILRLAVENGVLPRNALREIRPVSAQVVKPTTRERDTTRALTREERDSLIAHADKLALSETISPSTRRKRQTVADLLAFMAGTGIRINEARSLRWEDVDLETGAVNVNGTKSKASRRSLTLPEWLLARFKVRADVCGTEGLVFPSPHHLNEPERRWDSSNSAKAVARVIGSSGFAWATPHTLRRTVATLLDQAGVPIARIADQLGHADPAMTARVYLGRDPKGDKSSVAQHL
ncbi:site-specific integrase [Actinoplanes sp. NPDC051861]|uniref:tyrosine-type recombinase/integrase n=1 Tax=Actinoplanes sp. NPDC051861 TaxID=3155170 RepID=UPI0034123CDC